MIKKLKNSFKDMDKTLLMVSLLLFVFGLLNIVNASSKAVVVRYNTSLYGYFYKQALFLIIGFILMIFVIFYIIHYFKLENGVQYLYKQYDKMNKN